MGGQPPEWESKQFAPDLKTPQNWTQVGKLSASNFKRNLHPQRAYWFWECAEVHQTGIKLFIKKAICSFFFWYDLKCYKGTTIWLLVWQAFLALSLMKRTISYRHASPCRMDVAFWHLSDGLVFPGEFIFFSPRGIRLLFPQGNSSSFPPGEFIFLSPRGIHLLFPQGNSSSFPPGEFVFFSLRGVYLIFPILSKLGVEDCFIPRSYFPLSSE